MSLSRVGGAAFPAAETTEQSPAMSDRRESYLILGASLCINLIVAWWLTYVLVLGNGDALSRTANAFYVLFSRDPHLGAIGFVWPPLPSLLQVPLLVLLRPVGYTIFTGPLVTSCVGAGSLTGLNLVLKQLNTTKQIRWMLIAAVQLNPGYLYLVASGMAEPMLLFFILVAIYGYLRMPGRAWPPVIIGISLALGFYVRYEALALIGGVVAAFMIQKWPPWRNWQDALEARMLTVIIPSVYAVGLWIYANWQIMDDPLFFQRSIYSLDAAPDVARNVGVGHPLFHAWGDLWATVRYALVRLEQQNVAFLVVLLLAVTITLWKRDRQLGGLLLILLSVPAFTALQVYRGTLAPWMRYWFYATPFSALLIGAVAGRVRHNRALLLVPAVLLLWVAIPFSLISMGDPNAGVDEQRFSNVFLNSDLERRLREQDGYWRMRHDAPRLAETVDSYSDEGVVLADTETAYGMVLASRYPERLVITNDRDFREALVAPTEHVQFILVPPPSVGGARDKIGQQYPYLYSDGAPWATIEHEFTDTVVDWRLYRVRQNGG